MLKNYIINYWRKIARWKCVYFIAVNCIRFLSSLSFMMKLKAVDNDFAGHFHLGTAQTPA